MSQFWQNLQARLQPAVPKLKHAAAGEEVVERLLLDRVDAKARAAPVGGEHHRVADPLAHEAHAALALVQPAVARAQVALDATVVERVPPARRIAGSPRRLLERDRAVADDTVAVARRVAGVAQVQQARRKAVAARRQQRAIDRRRAAGLVRREAGIERQDALHGARSAARACS